MHSSYWQFYQVFSPVIMVLDCLSAIAIIAIMAEHRFTALQSVFIRPLVAIFAGSLLLNAAEHVSPLRGIVPHRVFAIISLQLSMNVLILAFWFVSKKNRNNLIRGS